MLTQMQKIRRSNKMTKEINTVKDVILLQDNNKKVCIMDKNGNIFAIDTAINIMGNIGNNLLITKKKEVKDVVSGHTLYIII